MKKSLLILILGLLSIIGYAQSKKQLKANISALNAKIELLNADIIQLKNQNLILAQDFKELQSKLDIIESKIQNVPVQTNPENKSNTGNKQADDQIPVQGGRCKAITASGNQCSRNAEEGSEYCWQHKKKFDNPENTKSGNQAPSNNNGSNYKGHEILTGPRGGKYYINSKGNKTYIRK